MHKGAHKLRERRHVRIACLGLDREGLARLVRACVEVSRPDDGFEFMIDATGDPAAAHDAAVMVETLWNDLPNPSLAHLCDLRNVLLLGADLVVDFTACAAPAAPAGPEIVDWDDPHPHGAPRRAEPRLGEEGRRALAFDMGMLCPGAPLVDADPSASPAPDLPRAVADALRRAEGRL